MATECSRARAGVEVASLSDIGRLRKNNEDSFIYWEPENDDAFARKGRLAVIADGMGGYEGGQEASRLAVETVRDVYERSTGDDPQLALLAGFIAAHRRIRVHAAQTEGLYGMGTTCTAVAVVGSQIFFAHIGDSRLYLVRQDSITRLTRDHSYVGRLVESGIVRSEDAERHPQRHILTAALGTGREVAPDKPEKSLTLEPAEALVLCTDGLWSLVTDSEIALAARTESPAGACASLVRLALERGGPDNITVQVLRFAP